METIVLLTILACIVFFTGAYYMGNFMLSSFHDDLQTRIAHTAYGVLCWVGIAFAGLICYGIYWLIASLFK